MSRQKLIKALEGQDNLARSLVHTFVKNIANGKFDKADAKLLKEGLGELINIIDDAAYHLKRLVAELK